MVLMLTDADCRNATCPPGAKRRRLTDGGGLYLEVSPAGSKRWFWKFYPDIDFNIVREGEQAFVELFDVLKEANFDAAVIRRSRRPLPRRRAEMLCPLCGDGRARETFE